MQVGNVVHAERAEYGKPLEGVRILALEQQQSLPYATMLLARLGAEVIRVEIPGRGETGRDTYPGIKDPRGRHNGATFLRNNLNKKSAAIDLKSAKGRELILRLAPRFDIVAENFRAGTLERLKLGYEDIAKVHPRVIYASVSGFGAWDSPYSKWSAFAPVVEAMAGHYDFKRPRGAPPQVAPTGVPMGDTGTGLFAAIGILAALRHRDRKGIGQHVDVAMYDCAVALADIALNYNSLGVGSGLETPSIVAAFKARDGYFVMMCSRRKQFEPLAKIVGHPEWLTDPRFPGPVEWGRHIEDVFRPAIEAWAAQYSKREACDILNGAGIAVGPSHSTGEILVDPHIVARNMVVEMPRVDGVEQPVMMPGNPIKLSKMAEGPDTRVPWLGEHTDEVLGAELGLDAAQLEALRTEGVIA